MPFDVKIVFVDPSDLHFWVANNLSLSFDD